MRQLSTEIRIIKNHLISKYGTLNKSELQSKYDETTKLTYNTSDSIDDMSNAVKNL